MTSEDRPGAVRCPTSTTVSDQGKAEATGMYAALLLAAGLSTRMGQPKPLLSFGGQPLVAYQVQQLAAAGVQDIVVVVGHESESVRRVLAGYPARLVFNPEFREGRATSVRCGARALSTAIEAVVILNVDQPRPASLIRRVLAVHAERGATITRPLYRGRGGHPTVFSATLLDELCDVSEASQGLRAVLKRHRAEVAEYEEEDERIVLDVNDRAAYQRALMVLDLAQSREWVMRPAPHSD